MVGRGEQVSSFERQGEDELSLRARRAAAEAVLREGGVVRIGDRHGTALDFVALDSAGAVGALAFARRQGDRVRLVVTATRARALGLTVAAESGCVALAIPASGGIDLLERLAGLSNPGRGLSAVPTLGVEPAGEIEAAAVVLAKRMALLPAVIVAPPIRARVDARLELELLQPIDDMADRPIVPIVQAQLPISAAEHARIVAFRSCDVPFEHVALVVGQPAEVEAPLVRLHSECLTGDVFGSLRCDCGPQLHAALARMEEEGAGVLLYLRQEGRGIGLINKLRAYRLQETGLDTIDANTHLGFDPDQRDFKVAARMLAALGIRRVKLLTNNPRKLESLAFDGIEVVEHVPLPIGANPYNRRYLATKVERGGHLILPEFLDGHEP